MVGYYKIKQGILQQNLSRYYRFESANNGINISPLIWQLYINAILDCLQSGKYCETIMDDLLLFMPIKKSHMAKLEDLLKALLKNGLKILQRRVNFFKKELQFMGNTIFIKDRRVCVKPLWSSLEAIQKLNPPVTAKGCRSFAGMVNFLSLFCPELQKLLKPIYDLTRKGRQLVWGEDQELAFEEIKNRLIKPPCYTYQTVREDYIYIQVLVNLLQAVLYIKFKMENLN